MATAPSGHGDNGVPCRARWRGSGRLLLQRLAIGCLVMALPISASGQDRFEAAMRSGVASLQAGDLAAAREAFQQALQHRPGDPAALSFLGNVLLQSGQPSAALQRLEQAVREQPSYYPARLWSGQAYLALGRLSEAIAALQEAARLAPEQPAPRALLAETLLHTDRIDEARAQALALVRLQPEEYASQSLLGSIELRRGDGEAARQAFDRALALRPDDARALYGKAAALATLHRDAEALKLLADVVEEAPDNADAWALFARLLVRNRASDMDALLTAAGFYQEALRIRPNDPGQAIALADLYRRLGMYQQGVELLERVASAAAARPDYWMLRGRLSLKNRAYGDARDAFRKAVDTGAAAAGWYQLGVALVNLADLEAATDAFRRAVDLRADDGAAWRELGRVLLDQNRSGKSLDPLRAAVQLLPDDVEAHLLYGRALEREKRPDEAVRQFEAAVRSAPDNEQALYALATALARRGDSERSQQLLAHLRDVRRQQGDASQVLAAKASLILRDAMVRFRLEFYDAAATLFQQVLDIEPDSELAALYLGLSRARLGDDAGAIAALEQAAAKNGKRAETWKALARLYERAGRAADARKARRRVAELSGDSDTH